MPDIGILDSGVGGLSVYREVRQLLADHSVLYLADQAHAPYGPQPLPRIEAHVASATQFLVEEGAQLVVMACHAASAAGLYAMRRLHPDVQFVGIEPAVKPAAERTASGVIGVLTTQATADGPLYRRVVERFASHCDVQTYVAPDLVQAVEDNLPEPEMRELLMPYVKPMRTAAADHIVLACTHFPFFADVLRDLVGPDVKIIDPGRAVAAQVRRVWPDGLRPVGGPDRFVTTGNAQLFKDALQRLIGVQHQVEHIDLPAKELH